MLERGNRLLCSNCKWLTIADVSGRYEALNASASASPCTFRADETVIVADTRLPVLKKRLNLLARLLARHP